MIKFIKNLLYGESVEDFIEYHLQLRLNKVYGNESDIAIKKLIKIFNGKKMLLKAVDEMVIYSMVKNFLQFDNSQRDVQEMTGKSSTKKRTDFYKTMDDIRNSMMVTIYSIPCNIQMLADNDEIYITNRILNENIFFENDEEIRILKVGVTQEHIHNVYVSCVKFLDEKKWK